MATEYWGISNSKPTKIYWNLHKHKFSIVQGGLVVRHLELFELEDVTFHVQPAGNAKVRKQKRKNVHAYLKGMPCSHVLTDEIGEAKYNPYKDNSFVMVDSGEPVHKADHVMLESYFNKDEGRRKPIITVFKK